MRKVFIVEDDIFITAIFTMFLKDLGHSLVGKTASGKEAIEKCKELKPDVVLMDIHLEGDLDGIQTAEMLKREIDIPVIYVSSDTTNQVIERAIVSNSYGYLVKPINKKELGISIDLAFFKHKVDLEQKEREKGYREFISDSPLSIIVIKDGKVQYLNKNGLNLFRSHYIEDIMGLPFSNFIHEDLEEEFKNALEDSIKHGKVIKPFYTKMKTVHGDVFCAEVTGSKVVFNGKVSVQIIIKDVSDEVLTKNRITGLENILLVNERLCFFLDSDYKIIKANKYTKRKLNNEDIVDASFFSILDERTKKDYLNDVVSHNYPEKIIDFNLKNLGIISFNFQVFYTIEGNVNEIVLLEK